VEPMRILIIFLIFIYRLKLKVDERVEIVLLSGRQGWTQRQVADLFNVLVFSIYSAFQISAEVDTELVIIITISIIQTEFYNKIQIIASL
jgi:hypothetical protein